MKKKCLLIGIIIGCFSASLLAQNIKLSKAELEQILCQQWEIEYAQMGGMKITQKIGAADFELKFAPDGVYSILKEGEADESGLWSYESAEKFVQLSIKDKVTSRILAIDKNKLVLKPVVEENGPPGMPNLEIHFKPLMPKSK